MTDRTPDYRDAQRTAVLALADLLTRDLPAAAWTVHGPYLGKSDGRLSGEIGTADPGEADRAARDWKELLGDRVVVRHHDAPAVPETVTVIQGEHRRVPVTVAIRLHREGTYGGGA